MKNQNKFDEIENKIKKLQKKTVKNAPIKDGNIPLNIAIELLSGVILGFILGFFLDNLFDSRPIFLIICLLFANIAAFRLIWKKYVKK